MNGGSGVHVNNTANRRCNTDLLTLKCDLCLLLVIKLLSVRESLCIFFTFGTVIAGKQLVQSYGWLPCFCVYQRILEGSSMVMIMETMIKLLAISSLWPQICQHMVNNLPLTVSVTPHTYICITYMCCITSHIPIWLLRVTQE